MSIEQLIKDEAFVARVQACQTLAELSALLQENGIEATEAELEAALAVGPEGELDESALENVAGGGRLGTLIKLLLPYVIRPTGPITPRIPKRK